MRTVQLQWSHPWSVKELYHRFKPDDYFKKSITEMTTYGFYMYLDEFTGKVRYIGQAFSKKKSAPLQHRVRWEIVKDGSSGTESAFYKLCLEHDIDKFRLLLKVAHLFDPKIDGATTIVDDRFMNAVERALIFERASVGDPLMNKTGKTRYRLGPIEIINKGDFSPLPSKISLNNT